VWGEGTVEFDRGTFRSANTGCLGPARNGAGAHGDLLGDCRLAAAATGWQLDRAPGLDAPGPAAQIRYGELQSTDFVGRPRDVRARPPASRQVAAAEALPLRNLGRALGGWRPKVC
jgi:hypothetical protein